MPIMEKALVIRSAQVSRDMFEVEFISPTIAQEGHPGQFVHVKMGAGEEPLLRRPFSLYDVDKKLGSVNLLYKIIGKGTNMMSRVKAKDYLDVIGPLGKGFTIDQNANKLLLIGGGVGIAPLIYLARVLRENGHRVQVLYGTDSRREMAGFAQLRQLEVDLMPATTDGSAGFKGTVIDLLEKKLPDNATDFVYACGPEAMMAKVQKWALRNGIKGEISLEEHMACGVGACLGCARKLKTDDEFYVKVCKDGPVFALDQIELREEGD